MNETQRSQMEGPGQCPEMRGHDADLLAALKEAHRTLMHLRSGGYFGRMNHADEMIAKRAESAARAAIVKAAAS